MIKSVCNKHSNHQAGKVIYILYNNLRQPALLAEHTYHLQCWKINKRFIQEEEREKEKSPLSSVKVIGPYVEYARQKKKKKKRERITKNL